ncbi:MBL fold metallo-hydrolase [Sulfurospirillum sp.]|nr:MBL fold metallo-hydrolase [Sulfurospirillum sp.]
MKKVIFVLLLLLNQNLTANQKVHSIDTNTLLGLLKNNPNIQIIDVRARGDILLEGGYIKANKVTNIPRGKLEFLIKDSVKKDEKFVVHCSTGGSSFLAAKTLMDMGYKNVLHYKDSYQGWLKDKQPISSLDKALNSILYSDVKKIAKGVYTSIGATQPGTYENSGHNNNLGFVIGDESVVVWNASSNYLLAKALHVEIKKITDKPIKYVVLENSQGHAMLGSNYWAEQGVKIISQEIAKEEIINEGEDIYERYERVARDKFLGTKLQIPDETFKDKKTIDLGGRIVELLYFGHAHEHSDIVLWLPKEKIVFAGDIAFNQRMAPILEKTDTLSWLEAWEKFAQLKAKIVVPGHGDVTDMPTTTKVTKGYITHLRSKIKELLDKDGELKDSYYVDQSPFEHLDTFKELAKHNAGRLFEQMEFE